MIRSQITISRKGLEGGIMKISIDKNLVEFGPETDKEKEELNELWKVVVDCVKFNKKLVPVGEYLPGKNDFARFAVEE
jgi:hypothetical protein